MAIDLKKKKQIAAADNPIEQLKDLATSAVEDVLDVPGQILDQALVDIGLKPQPKPLSGEINIASHTHTVTSEITDQAEGSRKIGQLRAVHRQEKEVFSFQKKATEQQVKQLMDQLAQEVRQLEKQTSELSGEVRAVVVETVPAGAGVYHVNFFEWIIRSLRDLRKRVNESRLWLNLWTQKKQQKGYWAMFKKHGTSFAMSEERAIAQAGG